MSFRIISSVALLATLLCSGCSTFTPVEIEQVRSRGVSPRVVAKLDRGGPLTPADIIELRRRGIADGIVLKQLETDGVDYLLSKDDVARMRRAGVSSQVIAAAAEESDRFAGRYAAAQYDVHFTSHYGDPYYGSGWYDPHYYGGYGYGYGYGRGYYRSGRGHRHYHDDHDHDSSRNAPFFSPRRIFR